jgi:hypothetical protein
VTFDEAFDTAAKEAKAVTVDEPLSSYWSNGFGKFEQAGRFRARKLRFAPTADDRVKAVEACRKYTQGVWMMEGRLPHPITVREVVYQKCGFGPLTMLWVFVMVVQLLAALKKLLNERGETIGVR